MNDTIGEFSGGISQPSEGRPSEDWTGGQCLPRLLVAIASYGTGHLKFLKELIGVYQSLPMHVHVVVFSESHKDLGPKVEVIVGLPSRNPWTLPFAHKEVFAQRVKEYDLFIYTEDDIGISAKNIWAFLEATAKLAPDEIAGFMRYEISADGTWFLAEPWGHFHWKPASVKQRGDYTIAEFTNEHAGIYALTQWQLERAIESGGFLRGPYKARYNWPETAATDPYTSCGFHKVVCISDIENFLVHHLPNRYVNDLPVSLPAFKQQIRTLTKIREGTHPATVLCDVEPRAWHNHWQKTYFEPPESELLALVPSRATRVLSIGCGWGATERILQDRGALVTAVPLDSVIGADVAAAGIEVVYGSIEESFGQLAHRQFDCVIMTNLLHLQPDPAFLLCKCLCLVREGGTLLLSGPNFKRVPWLVKRKLGLESFQKLREFATSGLSMCGVDSLASTLTAANFTISAKKWINHQVYHRGFRGVSLSLGAFTAREWIVQATRGRVKPREYGQAVSKVR